MTIVCITLIYRYLRSFLAKRRRNSWQCCVMYRRAEEETVGRRRRRRGGLLEVREEGYGWRGRGEGREIWGK